MALKLCLNCERKYLFLCIKLHKLLLSTCYLVTDELFVKNGEITKVKNLPTEEKNFHKTFCIVLLGERERVAWMKFPRILEVPNS